MFVSRKIVLNMLVPSCKDAVQRRLQGNVLIFRKLRSLRRAKCIDKLKGFRAMEALFCAVAPQTEFLWSSLGFQLPKNRVNIGAL